MSRSTPRETPPTRPAKKKRLGQHHLRDGRLCRPAVDYLQLEGASVVEIGPGGGVLTRELLDAAAGSVLALELDPEWTDELSARHWPGLRVETVDALEFDWADLEPETRIAGNLPYNVASALMERFLDDVHHDGTRCAFLVQREMADRWCAAPGESEYGSFSVLMAARCRERRILSRVRPGSFDPPPKVDSAFVGLELREPSARHSPWRDFKTTVRAAFQQRRKTVLNSLSASWGRAEARSALERAGLDPAARAETLCLADFEALFEARPRS